MIWADTVQFGIYLLGAGAAYYMLHNLVDGGWATIFATASAEGKLSVFHFSMGDGFIGIFKYPYQFVTAILGGMFLSMASHGTDHLMVQRLMACRDKSSGQKALIGSGLLAFVQFAIFLILGIGIWVFFEGKEMNSNEVFSQFIINYLPAGLAGFIVAGIFSAAMSTLSSSINALASSTLIDWIKVSNPEKYNLKMSRLLSVFWALVLIVGASLFTDTQSPLVEVGLAIASFTYGGLLGFFTLGRLKKQFSPQSVMVGFLSSLFVMISVVSFSQIAWPWFTPIGIFTMVSVSFVLEWSLSKMELT